MARSSHDGTAHGLAAVTIQKAATLRPHSTTVLGSHGMTAGRTPEMRLMSAHIAIQNVATIHTKTPPRDTHTQSGNPPMKIGPTKAGGIRIGGSRKVRRSGDRNSGIAMIGIDGVNPRGMIAGHALHHHRQ